LKADLLDVCIDAQEVGFLPEWHDLMAGVIQREPQESPEAGDHLVRRLGIGVHQFRNRIQGIE
jgi:hypothetical protein